MTIVKPPSRIRISASTVCQLNCVLCDAPSRRLKFDPSGFGCGFLRFSNFKKLINQNPQINEVELSWRGEIFLNPELKDIIKYAYERGVGLRANTGVNLNTVSKETAESLVKYKFKSLTVSIDGASQKTYQIYRKGGNFNRVIKNIILINRYKKKYSSELPRLTWQFILFGHNEHEIPNAKRIASELGMKFQTKLSWNEPYSPIINRNLVKKGTGTELLSRSEFLNKYGHDYMSEACRQPIFSPVMNCDGRLFGCCMNINFSFGNVFDEGLKECINKSSYKSMIRTALGNSKSDKYTPCTYCEVYNNNKGIVKSAVNGIEILLVPRDLLTRCAYCGKDLSNNVAASGLGIQFTPKSNLFKYEGNAVIIKKSSIKSPNKYFPMIVDSKGQDAIKNKIDGKFMTCSKKCSLKLRSIIQAEAKLLCERILLLD